MTNTTRKRLAAFGLAGAAAAALAAGATLHDTSAARAAASGGSTGGTSRQAPTPPKPGQEDARLAKALGVSEAKLKQARASVRADRLAAAVKAGRLTSEQGDLLERLAATGLDVPLPPGVTNGSSDPDEALAKALGVPVQRLRSARPAPPAGGPTPPSGQDAPKPPSGKDAPKPPDGKDGPKPPSGKDAPKPPSGGAPSGGPGGPGAAPSSTRGGSGG